MVRRIQSTAACHFSVERKMGTATAYAKYSHIGALAATMKKLFAVMKTSEFLYYLKKLRKRNGDFALTPRVPFGNMFWTQMAKATIKDGGVRQNNEIDFPTISYSSTAVSAMLLEYAPKNWRTPMSVWIWNFRNCSVF